LVQKKEADMRKFMLSSLAVFLATASGASTATLDNPAAPAVTGLYKVLRKGVRQSGVRRQNTPGGNLVRGTFKVAECPRVADPVAMPWTCRAQVTGAFRAEGDRGTRVVDVTFNWDPNAQRLHLISSDVDGATPPSVVALVERLPFSYLTATMQAERTCGDACNQLLATLIAVDRTVPGERCKAYYELVTTSDASPVRSFNDRTRAALATRFACP
jgi:hypothetical protein